MPERCIADSEAERVRRRVHKFAAAPPLSSEADALRSITVHPKVSSESETTIASGYAFGDARPISKPFTICGAFTPPPSSTLAFRSIRSPSASATTRPSLCASRPGGSGPTNPTSSCRWLPVRWQWASCERDANKASGKRVLCPQIGPKPRFRSHCVRPCPTLSD